MMQWEEFCDRATPYLVEIYEECSKMTKQEYEDLKIAYLNEVRAEAKTECSQVR